MERASPSTEWRNNDCARNRGWDSGHQHDRSALAHLATPYFVTYTRPGNERPSSGASRRRARSINFETPLASPAGVAENVIDVREFGERRTRSIRLLRPLRS